MRLALLIVFVAGCTKPDDTDVEDTDDTDVIAVSVVDATLECGDGDTGTALQLTASTGRIDVFDDAAMVGCCPYDFVVDVTVDEGAGRIDATYTVGSDKCDCACLLDASWAVVGVPAGTWTVAVEDRTGQVAVP